VALLSAVREAGGDGEGNGVKRGLFGMKSICERREWVLKASCADHRGREAEG